MTTRWLAAVMFVFLVEAGCSDRVTNDLERNTIEITLSPATSQSVEAAASEFRVIVSRLTGEVVVTQSLTLVGNELIGAIAPLTANQTFRFTIEAADESGVVLYRGSTLGKVQPYRATTLAIDLLPAVPMVKFSPSYTRLGANLSFDVDTRLFNLPDAYGISYRVLWAGDASLGVDSIVPSPAIADNPSVIFFSQLVSGPSATSYYAFSITETDTTATIVDASGDLDLVRIYYRIVPPFNLPYTTSLYIEVTSLTANDNGQIVDLPVDTLYVDDCTVELQPATTAEY